MLGRIVVPSRFAMINRSGEVVGYNPGLNTWERLPTDTAEVIRWLRAGRDRDGLEDHLARRFGYTKDAAAGRLRKILEWCVLRRLLYLDQQLEFRDGQTAAGRPLFTIYWICTQACNLRCPIATRTPRSPDPASCRRSKAKGSSTRPWRRGRRSLSSPVANHSHGPTC